jgi:hypothetical protein
MKKIFTILAVLVCLSSFAFSQQDGDNSLWGIPKISLAMNNVDTLKSLASRAIAFIPGPNSLDGDDLADIIVTDWLYGRVYVFEQVSKTSLEFKLVWTSPKKKAKSDGIVPDINKYGTPRAVTFGDLDGNGKKEIIFPIGGSSLDTIYSDTTYQRGLYFYECVGDNNYGTTPTILRTEAIDPDTKNYNWGIFENPGIIAADIDNDTRQEVLIASNVFSFNVDIAKNPSKAYVISIKSGTFAQKNVVFKNEYTYTKMALALNNGQDGYVPHGFTIADIDGDGTKEVIVTGRTTLAAGGAIGFFKTSGTDQYTDGSIVDLTSNNLNCFRVVSQLGTYNYQGKDIVFIKTDEKTVDNRILLLSDVIDIGLVGINNFTTLKKAYFGGFTGGAVADQDHGTGSDGFDFYFPYGDNSGGLGIYDLEYKGTGNIADSNNYKIYNIFDSRKIISGYNPGLYQIICPATDLNNNGRKEIITNFQYWSAPDSLLSQNIKINAAVPFFILEWGDKSIGQVDVKPMVMIMPDDYKLEQNFPNPFNPTTNIRFTLPASENINLTIFDVNGRAIRNLIDGKHYEKGSYESTWDARDNSGKPVSSGVYFYKLSWGNFEKSMKMTLLK